MRFQGEITTFRLSEKFKLGGLSDKRIRLIITLKWEMVSSVWRSAHVVKHALSGAGHRPNNSELTRGTDFFRSGSAVYPLHIFSVMSGRSVTEAQQDGTFNSDHGVTPGVRADAA